jgi:hypothetical protein
MRNDPRHTNKRICACILCPRLGPSKRSYWFTVVEQLNGAVRSGCLIRSTGILPRRSHHHDSSDMTRWTHNYNLNASRNCRNSRLMSLSGGGELACNRQSLPLYVYSSVTLQSWEWHGTWGNHRYVRSVDVAGIVSRLCKLEGVGKEQSPGRRTTRLIYQFSKETLTSACLLNTLCIRPFNIDSSGALFAPLLFGWAVLFMQRSQHPI